MSFVTVVGAPGAAKGGATLTGAALGGVATGVVLSTAGGVFRSVALVSANAGAGSLRATLSSIGWSCARRCGWVATTSFTQISSVWNATDFFPVNAPAP